MPELLIFPPKASLWRWNFNVVEAALINNQNQILPLLSLCFLSIIAQNLTLDLFFFLFFLSTNLCFVHEGFSINSHCHGSTESSIRLYSLQCYKHTPCGLQHPYTMLIFSFTITWVFKTHTWTLLAHTKCDPSLPNHLDVTQQVYMFTKTVDIILQYYVYIFNFLSHTFTPLAFLRCRIQILVDIFVKIQQTFPS